MRLSIPALGLLVLLTACSRPSPEPVAVGGLAFFSMAWQVKVSRLPPSLSAEELQSRLQRSLDQANKVLSTYQPDTELMRFNATPVGRPFSASPMLTQALRTACQVSDATDGVYDVTVGPLVDLWGFGPRAVPERIPDTREIDLARVRVGWRKLAIDSGENRLTRLADVQVDLSSIGEGVGVDALTGELEHLGINDYMVSVAGTLRVSGRKPDGSTWQIAVEKPDASGLPQQMLKLQGKVVVSTSGAYRNYHEIQGVRYSHTIDPRTGYPITHKGVSVTVVLPEAQATLADAWATALNALGPEEGLVIADKMRIPAYYLEKTPSGFVEKQTTAFQPFIGGIPR
jgi:thiamine biosynthesis lipoprotein